VRKDIVIVDVHHSVSRSMLGTVAF